MPDRLKFTKRALEALPSAPAGTRVTYHDSECNGLTLRVTDSGAKSFIVQRRINGRPERVTLGRFPEMTVEQARKAATGTHATINDGTSPNAVKRAEKARAVTLGDVLDDYLAHRDLKPATVHGYRRAVDDYLADWKGQPVAQITREKVERRHRKLTERGPTQANLVMRVLRALLNYAGARLENADGSPILADNPVRRLSATKTWNRTERRRTLIKSHQLKPWFDAVLALADEPERDADGRLLLDAAGRQVRRGRRAEVIRDWLLLLVLTGLRREEGMRLRIEDVDLAGRIFTVADTKNREPHTLPLSDYLLELVGRRIGHAREIGSPYLFPGEGRSGYLNEPRKQMAKVTAASGVTFTPHDLRRTFITIAESLDIPAYALKRLLNHKSGNSDVTAGYIVIDTERLREPMQRITDFMLKAAGLRESATVVPIHRNAG